MHGGLGNAKKLTYAASIGHGVWRDYRWKDDLLTDIRAFEAISVREAVARDELASLGVNSTLVPDPTLLLDVKDYDKIMQPITTKKPYIFAYLLSEYDRVRPMMERVRLETHKGVHLLAPSYLKDSTFAILDPSKWLYAISHSSFVITDSFHGTALSLVFNVPFATILKPGLSMMNGRVTGLLNTFGLDHRVASSASDIIALMNEPIKWDVVNGCMERTRATGRSWLAENLR